MNKFFAIIAAVVLLAVSCGKDMLIESGDGPVSEVVLDIASPSMFVKADIQNADEAKVNSVQVFVFRGDEIDAYKSAGAVSSLTLSATQGVRDIYVVVNAPDLSSVSGKAALLAGISNLTADNASDSFVMVGSLTSQTLNASYEKTVEVNRIAARIKISKVTRDFSASGASATDFKIVRFYISNAVDNCKYDFSAPASLNWLNAEFANGGAISTSNSFVYKKLSTAAPVSEDGSYSESQVFYVYPNELSSDATTGNPPTYTGKATRLCVEVEIDGQKYVYPICVGAIQCNKSYEISNLTLTRKGNPTDGDDVIDDEEDDPIAASSISLSVEVNDWTQVLTFGDVTGGEITI